MSDALAQLPIPGTRRLAVRVTADAMRHLRAGHPWVYANSITSVSHDGAPGDLAVVFDRDRQFAAIGLWDPASPIRIKVLHHATSATIDRGWWDGVVRRALQRRAVFVDAPDAGQLGYRVLNGESDGTPGLVADRYASTLVVKVYSSAWFAHLRDVVAALVAATNVDGAVVRLARGVAAGETFGLQEGDVIAGVVPEGTVRFREHGLAFDVDVRHGQKTGHFLDQRHNRGRVASLAGGRHVLDVFASTGGFSVHAAAGGAVSVHAIDASAPTLAAAEHNLEINRERAAVSACRFTIEVGDAFEVLGALGGRRAAYDMVIVDPPSFAQRQSDVERGVYAYGRLTRLALAVMRPGGILVQASCSSRVPADRFYAAVYEGAAASGRELTEIARTGHDIDHPADIPEAAYLKAGFWRAR